MGRATLSIPSSKYPVLNRAVLDACDMVTAKIGEGGMGEVWQARDTKLDRDAALNPDRLARFEREATQGLGATCWMCLR